MWPGSKSAWPTIDTGLPGIQLAGCAEKGINTVVHCRMKTQTRGWERDNAQAMLAALSELHSGRFITGHSIN